MCKTTVVGLTLTGLALAANLSFIYPKTHKVEQVDDYHGVRVADPYRWLEDDKSPQVTEWVAAENKMTFGYFDQIPYRLQVRRRLEKLMNYAKYTAPVRRGDYFFFSKNDGLQNQNVWYVQKGLEGTPDVLLDPNKFSTDGTSRLGALSVSRDGKYLVYGISTGGSDWLEAHVMEVATRKVLTDDLKWIKASNLAWTKDGFFYSRYPAPEPGHELSTKNENHIVYFHRTGTSQTADQIIYEDKAHPQRFHNVRVTEDQHFAILTISDRGIGKKGNALLFRELTKPESKFTAIVPEITDDSYGVLDNVGGKFLIETDHNAPNGRVALYDPEGGNAAWKDALPEKQEPLESVTTGGGKLFAIYAKDVASHAYVYTWTASSRTKLRCPVLVRRLDLAACRTTNSSSTGSLH